MTATHVLLAAVVFNDGGTSERSYIHRGDRADCYRVLNTIPGIAYNGHRQGGKGMLLVREIADADAAAVRCRMMVARIAELAGGELAAALPEVGHCAPGSLEAIAGVMDAYLRDQVEAGALLAYDLGAGVMRRSSDNQLLLTMTGFLQRDPARSVRWDGRVDRAGALVDSTATYERSFLVRLDDPSVSVCGECQRTLGVNPNCLACLEHAPEGA